MRNYKAYVFDMDLTLLNTIETAIQSYDAAFKACGLRFDENTVTHHLTIPLDASYDEIKDIAKAPFETFLREFDRVTDATFLGSTIYEDGLALIRGLYQQKKKLGIVTNRHYSSVEAVLNKAGILHLFSSIITCDKVAHLKPNPEPINASLNELGVAKEEMVYIGDAKNDWLAAENAGVDFIAVERYDNCHFGCKTKIHSLLEIKQ